MTVAKSPKKAPRRAATLVMAVIGASLFLLFLSRDLPGGLGDDWAKQNFGLVIRYVIAMTIGGAFMGFLLAPMFGRSGVGGWVTALVGGLLSTFIAGAFGSFFGLLPDLLSDGWQASDLVSILFGFAVLPLAAAENISSSLIWLVMVIAAHVLSLFERRKNTVYQ
ncbi:MULTISPECIES: hypothetical protein [unclassified Ruegeria]|uniref:hypothetical protein n=1 Tax=unclassified Ruegeria TaxID=2625375 RepID=UPI0014899673|nr:MULTISPECIES: hypothetical protein [unclassified Ruegeria]